MINLYNTFIGKISPLKSYIGPKFAYLCTKIYMDIWISEFWFADIFQLFSYLGGGGAITPPSPSQFSKMLLETLIKRVPRLSDLTNVHHGPLKKVERSSRPGIFLAAHRFPLYIFWFLKIQQEPLFFIGDEKNMPWWIGLNTNSKNKMFTYFRYYFRYYPNCVFVYISP